MKFVGVTSCPTGIAHTYMAAEGLSKARLRVIDTDPQEVTPHELSEAM